jgi:5-methylcytosine-specific restriction endonuclease McrA
MSIKAAREADRGSNAQLGATSGRQIAGVIDVWTQTRDNMNQLELAKHLTDDEVMLLLQRNVRGHRENTAQMLVHLGEVDERGLFRGEGYSSMFEYTVGALHMSEAETSLRIRAARFVRKFPQALEMVASGELHLSAICLLAPVVTDQTVDLLHLARHKSKSELHKLIVTYFPRPDVRSEVRKLPAHPETAPENRCGTSASAANQANPLLQLVTRENAEPAPLRTPRSGLSPDTVGLYGISQAGHEAQSGACPVGPLQLDDNHPDHRSSPTRASAPGLRTPGSQIPLSETRYKIQFTASAPLNDKLNEAKALLRREVRNGDLAAVFERALDLLIADRRKKMFGLTNRPRRKSAATSGARATGESSNEKRPNANLRDAVRAEADSCSESSSKPQARSRYLPRELRRQVYLRDEGQCRFLGPGENRCSSREYLEFHHVVPFARGGSSEVENVELRCRAHNQFEAERDYGRTVMKERAQHRQAQNLFVCPDQLATTFTQPANQAADKSNNAGRLHERSLPPWLPV